MKAATLKKIRTAEEKAYAVVDGYPLDESRGDGTRDCLSAVFGKKGLKALERAESISCAVTVVAGMLPKSEDSNARRFDYLVDLKAAEDHVRKWTLKDLFPALNAKERKAVGQEMREIGFAMHRTRVTGFTR